MRRDSRKDYEEGLEGDQHFALDKLETWRRNEVVLDLTFLPHVVIAYLLDGTSEGLSPTEFPEHVPDPPTNEGDQGWLHTFAAKPVRARYAHEAITDKEEKARRAEENRARKRKAAPSRDGGTAKRAVADLTDNGIDMVDEEEDMLPTLSRKRSGGEKSGAGGQSGKKLTATATVGGTVDGGTAAPSPSKKKKAKKKAKKKKKG